MLQKNSCLDPSSEVFNLSYEGLCRGWDSYFSELTETDFNTPLKYNGILNNPYHEVTQLLLYLYTGKSKIYPLIFILKLIFGATQK